MVHIMMRFHRIKCLPVLLLGLTHKLALFCSSPPFFPPPIPHLGSGCNLSPRHASGSLRINDSILRWGFVYDPRHYHSGLGEKVQPSAKAEWIKPWVKVKFPYFTILRWLYFNKQAALYFILLLKHLRKSCWIVFVCYCVQTPLLDENDCENHFFVSRHCLPPPPSLRLGSSV